MNALSLLKIELAERGLVPDPLLRAGIRGMCRERLRQCEAAGEAGRHAFLESLDASPIALLPDLANSQHYEFPAAFFERVLGPRLKYSGCFFPEAATSLEEAEEAMLALTSERAGIEDGMEVLDLGCGWGSFALWAAERHPHLRVLAVSNSKVQREFILGRCRERGLDRVEVVTADINAFSTERRFDRVVSVEMIEHTRNWRMLLARISRWLRPDGRVFLHHFAHREHAYPYEAQGANDWMARHFFSGGMMPSDDLVRRYPEHLEVEAHWRVSGVHYQRTADAWLERLDAARDELRPVFAEACGADAERMRRRWRLFFLGCAELFGLDAGEQWFVSHHRLAPSGSAR